MCNNHLFIGGPADGDLIPVSPGATVWNVLDNKPRPVPTWGDVLRSFRDEAPLDREDKIQIHTYRLERIHTNDRIFAFFVHEDVSITQAVRQLLVRYSGGRLDD